MSVTAAAAPEPIVDPSQRVSPAYRRYVMCLLLGIYILNFVDRQIVNILAEPIKQDLGLADWQLGMMGGLAFAVLYTTLGIPISLMAERRSRPFIIATAIAVWSAFTALCGLAQNFLQLVLARIGVGVGEAGCTPPAHSLIMDYAPPEKRSSALAFYGMGVPIGGLLGMAIGGIVADAYGWRTAFLIAAAPGIVFCLLTFVTLKEPRDIGLVVIAPPDLQRVTMRETLRVLLSKRSFPFISAGIAINSFVSVGTSLFMASFFLRLHGDEVARLGAQFGLEPIAFLGVALGLIHGIFGTLGMWCGGQFADIFGAKDRRWYMWGSAIAALLFVGPFVLAITTGSLLVSLAAFAVSSIASLLHYGPSITAALSIAPPRMRAPASALQLFFTNLVGLGLGPIAVGAFSDHLAVSLGVNQGLRWAIVYCSFVGVIAAGMFMMAARTLREDMAS